MATRIQGGVARSYTEQAMRELMRSISILYREAGDLLADATDFSIAVGKREANKTLQNAMLKTANDCVSSIEELKELRRKCKKMLNATATMLKVELPFTGPDPINEVFEK